MKRGASWGLTALNQAREFHRLMSLTGLVITTALYTPCTKFCERPPSGCKTDKQMADFRATCEQSCSALEKQKGLTLWKTTAEKKMATETVSGGEYVEALVACSFANGAGAACEKVVGNATKLGLWCAEEQ